MFSLTRSVKNPLISPDKRLAWQAVGSFNPSPVKAHGKNYLLYRAISETKKGSIPEQMSTIGIAEKNAHGQYKKMRQFITPEYVWEKYGCEDPRVVKIEGKYFIFYTALSEFPFRAEGIKVAVAISKDMKKIKERHLITPFNAKAMALFPEKIAGKYFAILSVNTDKPPAKMSIVSFDTLEEMWDEEKWAEVYDNIDYYSINPRRSDSDHVEVGAPPIKTKFGWLVIYSHIQNYFGGGEKIFGIEALLLDLHDPKKIIGKTRGSLLSPQEPYELNGAVPNIVFPTGAEIVGENLQIYYGSADTSSCMALLNLNDLIDSIFSETRGEWFLRRYHNNPILLPNSNHKWEAQAVFNPAAIDLHGTVHILYRALSQNNTSTVGYAQSKNGLDITYRGPLPIYVPREDYEIKKNPGNSGCEDPRLVKVGKTIYIFYTAFNGTALPQVAVSSIQEKDFLAQNWQWTKPILITPSGIDDKDTCILPEKVKGKWVILHRIGIDICADYLNSLNFEKNKAKKCIRIFGPRNGMWDSDKIGISAPPLKTKHGWLLLYHGISRSHHTYRVGAVLLSLSDPTIVLARSSDPILEPEEAYEKVGVVPNVVFPCGIIERKGILYVYYGGADKVVGVATVKMKHIFDPLLHAIENAKK